MKKYSVDIAIPVYFGNIKELGWSIKNQVEFYKKHLKDFKWTIVIAINGKNSEKIIAKSRKLSKKYKNVKYIYTPLIGKGAGVMEAWKNSKADIMAYMDVDLATNLHAVRNLFNQIIKGYDISTGSRYHPLSVVKRNLWRKITSMGYYVFFTKLLMRGTYRDAQCGFKAVNKEIIHNILPLIKDHNWFFESEMMYLAFKKGYKIKEIPVIWKETWDSTIHNLWNVVREFFKKSLELRFRKI